MSCILTMDRVHFVLRLPLACTGQKESEVDWLKETTVWVEGVTKDLVVVEEVGRVAWEVLKLMLLNGVAKVEAGSWDTRSCWCSENMLCW